MAKFQTGLTKSRVRVTATSATPAMPSKESTVVERGAATAKREKSSVQRCSPTLVSQNVLRSEGTLIRVHSVSRKVFSPKLAMYCRFVLHDEGPSF